EWSRILWQMLHHICILCGLVITLLQPVHPPSPRAAMPPAHRKIVFHMPSLVTEDDARSGSREVAPESVGGARADPLPAPGAEATPEVVPHLSEEPEFLHRAVSRDARGAEDVSFLCVPILMDGLSAGTLAVEMPVMAEGDAERMIKVLRIAAAMISQAVRIHRLVEGERQRLVEENSQLREELR